MSRPLKLKGEVRFEFVDPAAYDETLKRWLGELPPSSAEISLGPTSISGTVSTPVEPLRLLDLFGVVAGVYAPVFWVYPGARDRLM